MHIPVLKSAVVSGALGLSFFLWQGWQETLVVELDPRLDAAAVHGLIETRPAHQELSLSPASTLWKDLSVVPAARLRLSFDKPGKGYVSAIKHQIYVQAVGSFQNLEPPVTVAHDGSLALEKGRKVYAADPLIYSRYHREIPGLVLLSRNQDVRDRLRGEKGAVGIIRTQDITPSLRAMTPPVPLRLWVGWQASPSRLFSALGLNFRLYGNVARLLANTAIEPKPRVMTMIAVGDIMLGRRIGDAIDQADKRGEPLYPFASTAGLFRNADIAAGNLECAVSTGGTPAPGKDYTFRAGSGVARRLKAAGFDLMTLANNHSLDYGDGAFRETLSLLHKEGIATVGGGRNSSEARAFKVISLKDGTRVGFLAYTLVVPKGFAASSKQAGVNWMDDRRFKKQIRNARRRADIVVVQFHWGKEYEIHPDAVQRAYGRLAVDYGADLVIGHHPHWIQEMEFYQDRLIVYSLGNFVFDMNHRPKVREGLVLTCRFKDKQLYQVELDPVLIQRGQPQLIPWGSPQKRSREAILKEVFAASRML